MVIREIQKETLAAEKRIKNHIRETPLIHSTPFSRLGNTDAYLKLENLQITGSFKLRGALNKIFSLTKKEMTKGLITASTGNHGLAFAHTLKTLGLRGTLYLPENASQTKIDALCDYDVDLKFHGIDCVQTEAFTKQIAEKTNMTYISPYNDSKIVGGHGTVGIELIRQSKTIDSVLVPVGGGGLISGIAGYLKSLDRRIEVIGCQPENSPVMYESIKAGRIIEMESKSTISEGTAGGIEPGAITFEICKKLVDDYILVSEGEIKNAIKLIVEKHSLLVEGAGALTVASFLKRKDKFKEKNVILILSGARIGLSQMKEVLREGDT